MKTDWEAATDLTTLLKKLYNENESLQRSPLFIVAESYGGRFAVTLGLLVVKAIKAGTLKLKLGGMNISHIILSNFLLRRFKEKFISILASHKLTCVNRSCFGR